MGNYAWPAAILGVCILLAAFEVYMARRRSEHGADATDWKRARGIVWIGVVLGALAWFVQYMTE